MDKIDKTLAKIPAKQRKLILQATAKIIANDLTGLDVKKIKGNSSVFRIRVGQYRIVFERLNTNGNIVTLIAKRDEKTYKGL
jgi:mRNA-degrading endonuclease RelE of RelBE toxin-antitoxin system